VRTAAIVPVAGLSSRMECFKPLMTLNGFSLIQLTVQSALDGGVDEVVVVLGREGDAVRASLCNLEGSGQGYDEAGAGAGADRRISFVENPDFARTDMLASVQQGLRALEAAAAGAQAGGVVQPAGLTQPVGVAAQPIDTLFVLPGDSPAIHPSTFGALRACAERDPSPLAHPCYQGNEGHPLLIKRACFGAVLGFAGEGGLRAALSPYERQEVAVDDEGILLDADVPRDFELLEFFIRRTKGVSDELAKKLLDDAETPQNVREHCRAVSALVARMVARLNALGLCLDSRLCRSGALLHDMCRVHQQHEQRAAQVLHAEGYAALARLVEAHGSFSGADPERITESLLVCVADKLVKGTRLVTPDERYAPAMEKFSASDEVGKRIRQDLLHCKRFLTRYEALTGDYLCSGNTE